MSELKHLLIASNNSGKCKEIKEFLSDTGLQIYTLKEWQDLHGLPQAPDPEETGTTYLENALIKAKACADWAAESGQKIATLADDSGIEVAALDGAPGLYSARYAGENVSFVDNVDKMLSELEGEQDRSALFRAVLVFYKSDSDYSSVEGVLLGAISEAPSGDGGFGYDPIFIPEGEQLSLAEIKKNKTDFSTHRTLALIELAKLFK